MGRVAKYLPFLSWGPISAETFRADLVAGITVALILIPQSMAYAQLAGLPAYFGLYAAFLPVVVAALFGSSRQLATGPVAVVSLLTASALVPLVGAPEGMSHEVLLERYVPYAIMLALLVGLFQLLLGAFRLGVVVNFLSHPVIIGFTNAAAIIIGLSQLATILGVSMRRSESFLVDIWGVLQQLGQVHLTTLLFGLAAFALMWGCKRFFPRIPGVLVAVVSATVVSWWLEYEAAGGAVVGVIPQGLPELATPAVDWGMLGALMPSAIVISLVGFMEAISIAKAMAVQTRDRIDPNQELIGQGLANVAGSFSLAYPTSGSFSRSAVNLSAGARTGLSSVFTGLVVVVTLLFLTPLLYHLPKAVLAAVIMMAVFGLVNLRAIRHAWQANRHDGVASLITFAATLLFAPHLDNGILIGAGLAIGLYLYRTMRPRVAQLGRAEDGTLRDIAVFPDLPSDRDIMVLRFDGELYFANVAYFEQAVMEAVAQKTEARYLLVAGGGINILDASGEAALAQLHGRLEEQGISLVLSGFKRQVLDVMRRTGLFDSIGDENIFATEDLALAAIYRRLGAEGMHGPLLPGKP
jgi:SulP family sulfate permease